MTHSPAHNEAPRRSALTLRKVTLAAAVLALLIGFRFAVERGSKIERLAERGVHARTASFIWWKYTQGNGNLTPPWDPRPGHLLFDRSGVIPTFEISGRFRWEDDDLERDAVLTTILDGRRAHELENAVDESRYFYLPYAVTTEEEGMALIEAYREQVRKGGNFEGHLPAPPGLGTAGSDRFYRCITNLDEIMEQEGAPNRLGGRIAKLTTVMIERPTEDSDGQLWTVNLANQPILLPYPGRFPVTESFLKALAELEAEMRSEFDPPQSQPEDGPADE